MWRCHLLLPYDLDLVPHCGAVSIQLSPAVQCATHIPPDNVFTTGSSFVTMRSARDSYRCCCFYALVYWSFLLVGANSMFA